MHTQNTHYISKDLVLIGGGHSHLEVLRQFGMNPVAGVRVTLISKDIDTPYSGMIPGLIAGQYHFDQTHIDLGPLARFCHAQFIHGQVSGIDPATSTIQIHNRPPIHYDTLSINVGSQPNTNHVKGAKRYTLPVKPIDQFISSLDSLSEKLKFNTTPFSLFIVGGGVSSIEIALAYQHRLATQFGKTSQNIKNISLSIVTSEQDILITHNPSLRRKLNAVLAQRNIRVITQTKITEITETHLICANNITSPYDKIIWATNASPQQWLSETTLQTDDTGFLLVNEFLQSTSHSNVFAAGDIASSTENPRPKSGVFAVRQGPILAKNLRAALLDQPFKIYKPQRQFLSLIGTGDAYAFASRGQFWSKGKLIWLWKKSIDQKFMHKYNDIQPVFKAMQDHMYRSIKNPLGQSTSPTITEDNQTADHNQMRCGGCGAKVGSEILQRTINRIRRSSNACQTLDQHDDAAIIDIPLGKQLVQSVDYFKTFTHDTFSFGQIAANHALGDLYAMGAEPHSVLAIATLPFLAPNKTEETLFQLMSGAVKVLDECGAQLVGGHTSEGSDLCFGLTVNGLANPVQLMTKHGLQAGDCLILTKPLGTGMLLAADMQLKAKGRWVAQAFDMMMQSNQAASQLFIANQITTCTDITGFGLFGHLMEMLHASNSVSAIINIEALPQLSGIPETLSNNIVSTLHANNMKTHKAITNESIALQHPLSPLLFDPQTAGGLLAAVRKDKATSVLKNLRSLGYCQANIIGEVIESTNTPRITIDLS